MRIISLYIFFSWLYVKAISQTSALLAAQPNAEDSLLKIIQSNIHDTIKVAKYIELASKIPNRNNARVYLEKAYELSLKSNYAYGEYGALFELSFNYNVSGEWARGLEYALKGIEKSKTKGDKIFLSPFYNVVALSYEKQNDFATALKWSKMSIASYSLKPQGLGQPTHRWAAHMSAAGYMSALEYPVDSVFYYAKKSIALGKEDGCPENLYGYSYLRMAWSFARLNNIDSARFYFHKVLNLFTKYEMYFSVQEVKRDLAKFYFENNRLDSVQYYASQAYDEALKIDNVNVVIDAAHLLFRLNEKSNEKAAFAYLKKYNELKDSIFNKDKYNQIYQLQSSENQKLIDQEKRTAEVKAAKRQNFLLFGGSLFASVALGLGLVVNQKQRSKNKIEKAYSELTQVKTLIEHKNRDLEIEGSLERVRTNALAMQNSDELISVANSMREQMGLLGQPELETTAVHLYTNDADSFDSWYAFRHGSESTGKVFTGNTSFRIDSSELTREMVTAYHADIKDYTLEATGSKLQEFAKVLMAAIPDIKSSPDKAYYHFSDFSGGSLLMVSYQPPSDESKYLLKRCASVFDLAYRRYVDLQKAEAQTREARIEASLERVRSRSLVMHNSDELNEVVKVLYRQFEILGVGLYGERTITIVTFNDDKKDLNCFITGPEFQEVLSTFVPYTEHSIISDAWKAKADGLEYFSKIYPFEEKNMYWNWAFEHTNNKYLPDAVKKMLLESDNYASSLVFAVHSGIYFPDYHGIVPPYKDVEILLRFAKVFDQSYIRFLDLQKAEAQSREAQIEASLERVRSNSMAMQSSTDLADVIKVVNDQLQNLGLVFEATLFVSKSSDKGFSFWVKNVNQPLPAEIYVPYTNIAILNRIRDIIALKGDLVVDLFSFEDKNIFFQHLFDNTVFKYIPQERKSYVLNASGLTNSAVAMKNISLFVYNYQLVPYTDTENAIIKRFAYSFEQAYTRFLDLQKAEAQANEAKIEVALERVRSKTMAMHHSSHLREIAATTLAQLQSLGFTYGACSIVIMDAETGDMDWWISGFDNEYPRSYRNTYFEHPFYLEQLNNWKEAKNYAVMVCEGDAKKEYDQYVFSKTDFVRIPEELQKIMQAFEKITFSNAYMKYGALSWSTEPLSDEYAKILQRFASVFEQSYTRFLDLQKAEAQTREAQIESALERVRSRSLAMHHSDELAQTANVLFNQVTDLGVNAFASVFHIWQPDGISTMCWANGGEGMQPPLRIPHLEEPFHKSIYDAWKRGDDFYILESEGIALANTYRFIYQQIGGKAVLDNIEDSGFPIPDRQVTHIAFFTQGYVMFNTYEKTQVSYDVFKRFAKVFEQTYTRFLDLQKAEAQAREAQIEASLERIRSRAMAMNTSEELSTLIGFIYTEYTKLNMHLDRGFIMTFDTVTKDAYWWMVSADAPDMPLKILVKYHEYAPNLAILKGWEEREQRWSYILEGNNKKNWDDYQFANALSQMPDFVKDNMRSVERVILNASFQNFGCIMLSSFEPLSEDHFDLLIRLSKVFDLTYVRFLDLQLKEQNAIKLYEEKQKLEQTLTELKATQAQLIQSEKLASLGELTAGIAHEIQNPLNFVNNFSELNKELVTELNAELSKGNTEDVKSIANDIKDNSEKINQHGQRASSIVKGMLEHSRKSSGEKTLTDINAMCDEYLRLSYQGLRAKDKNLPTGQAGFNADYKTDLDPNMPKINVVSQDIARVLLNLINNAFQACAENLVGLSVIPQKDQRGLSENQQEYKPLVTVSTKYLGDKIKISVTDNGSGIPDHIRDKIFQPFFTTKPTGQGTGLGLSLAYDIVTKGHGGKIEVESEEGVGTEFIVKLPVQNNLA